MSNLSGTQDPTPVDAATIVGNRFNEAQEFVETAYEVLEDAINELAQYDPGNTGFLADAAEVDIDRFSGNYAFPDIPSPPNLIADFPDAPTRPNLGTLPSVVLPDVPDADIPVFNDAFAFSQTRYIRDGLTDYRLRLVDFIENGGTGISAAVEAAIYARDKARQELIDQQSYLEIQNTFESRGNAMPSGQHNAALNSASKERARMFEEFSRAIMIKAAELEQENMRIAQDSLSKTDTILVGLHNAEEDRALQTETTRISSTIAVYEAYIRGVIARLQAHKITVDSTVAFINANVALITANAQIYTADVRGFSAEVDAEARRLGASADIYASTMGGVEAAIRGISALASIDIAEYEVESKIEIANSQNQLAVHRLNLDSVMKRIDTRVEGMKAIAAVSAQIVASALNQVSTSASIGQSSSSSFSHAYDELKDVDTGIATSHSFSGTIES